MSRIHIPDHVIMRLVDDIDRSMSRSRYEELLVASQLFGISTLRDDPDYTGLNKREMIAATLQERCNSELLAELHGKGTLSEKSYRALSNLGHEFGQSVAGDLADPIEETSRLESELARKGMKDVTSFLWQSLDNYAEGRYEAANAMTRTALERLVQIAAETILGMGGGGAVPSRGRYLSPSDYRTYIHKAGFLDDAEKHFLDKFYAYASTDGPHPGLSSEAEARLRKFVVVGICLLYLEKLDNHAFVASLVP